MRASVRRRYRTFRRRAVEAAKNRLYLVLAPRADRRAARRHRLVGVHRWWRTSREFQIAFLKDQGLLPHHSVLDLGCGTLRGGIPIIQYLDEDRYVGIDVRPVVLEEALQELREHGLESKRPTLVCTTRLSAVALDRSFDIIWAHRVLIHLYDDQLEEMLAFSKRHLAPAGRFFADVNVGTEQGSWKTANMPLIARPVAAYEAAAQRVGLRAQDLGPVGEWQRVHMLRFTA